MKTFLNRTVNFEGNVLLLTEEPKQILAAKFSDLGLGTDRLFILPRHNVQNWAEAVGQIEFMIKNHDIKLVIVDTLAAFWGVKDENSASGVMASYLLFQGVIQSNDVSGVLIHHLRKSEGEDGTAVRGSNALLAAVDVTIEMEKQGDTQRQLSVQSRYSDVAKDEFIVGLENGSYKFVGTANQFMTLGVMANIVEFLKFRPDFRFDAVQIRHSLTPQPSKSAVVKALARLVEEKVIIRTGKGTKGSAWVYRMDPAKTTVKMPENSPKKPQAGPRRINKPEGGAK